MSASGNNLVGSPATAGAVLSSDLPAADRIESARDVQPVIFFDGVCGLCNQFIDFVIRRDTAGTFCFAPLQGETARERLSAADTTDLATVVLLDETGTHRRSKAVVQILMRLGTGWKIAGVLLAVIPRPLRDLGYKLVARFRYALFGKKETCRMPTPEERLRFLP
jgi:predicted DCC family thiol-disulfide oxidoreductase YuxK